jgi:ketose-bisphosphate aldolase
MPLVSMKTMLRNAQENKYAIGYFESWNLESTLSVIDAAEKLHSPVIIGFSGMFLNNKQRSIEENIYHYGSMGKAIAECANVPVCLLLNESDSECMLIKALNSGFNAIMYSMDGTELSQLIEVNKYIVKTAHYLEADVEAEIGDLPTADISTNSVSNGSITDPDKAVYFVNQTGVDALAISTGNVHLLEGKKSRLDLRLIKTLREKLDIPLVLHGGTGIFKDDLKEAIALGICKLNVGTSLKRVYINSIKNYLIQNDISTINPHDMIGKGGNLDLFTKARYAMSEEVIRFIKILGSENKAIKI